MKNILDLLETIKDKKEYEGLYQMILMAISLRHQYRIYNTEQKCRNLQKCSIEKGEVI